MYKFWQIHMNQEGAGGSDGGGEGGGVSGGGGEGGDKGAPKSGEPGASDGAGGKEGDGGKDGKDPGDKGEGGDKGKTVLKDGDKGEEGDKGKKDGDKELKLKLPKDSFLDESVVDRIAAEAKEQGLSQEDAQKLLDRENTAVSTYLEAQQKAWDKQVEGWAKEIKQDPELGGDNFNKNVETAKRALEAFDEDGQVAQLLDDTGYGNNPTLLRFLVSIGKQIGEDNVVFGTNTQKKKTLAERMFPSMANTQ